MTSTVLSFSLFAAFAVFTAAVSFLVFTRKSKSAVNISFSLLCLSLCVWFSGFAGMLLNINSQNAALWEKISFAGTAFVSVLLLKFIYSYSKTLINERFFLFFYLFAAAAAVLNFYGSLFSQGASGWFVSGSHGSQSPLFLLIPSQLIIFTVLASKNLKEHLRTPELTSFKLRQILKIRASLILFFLVAAEQFLSYFLFPAYLIGSLSAVFFVSVIVFALGRYSFADVKIALARIFIFLFIASFTAGLSYFAWKLYDFWAAPAIVSFISAFIGAYIFRTSIEKTKDLFLAYQRKYHNTLIQAASGMAREHELDKLLKLLSIMVMRSVNVASAAVFIGNESGKHFECAYIRPSVSGEMLFPYSANHPFITFMKNKGKPFVTADLPIHIANSVSLPFKSSLIAPFFFKDGAQGFVVLGPKKNKVPFDRDDIKVFGTLARQTALAIENCMFFGEFKATQEKIFTAEKLASVGGLAEGVAHQINNRLNQFSMLSAELKLEIEDFVKSNADLVNSNGNLKKTMDYVSSMSDSLSENIKRTDGVIKGILNYARSEKYGNTHSEFPLREVFGTAVELLKLKHKLHKDLVFDFDFKDGDKIYAIRSQITESVYNVLDNAYEAVFEKMENLGEAEKETFKPVIKADLKYYEDKAVFSVADNGNGIKDENKVKIFAPFFTTKSSYKSGTGIGLYIVKRMIEENHGGKLSFESKVGQGTKIIFELPLKEG
ncbi:MAG: hypothetical protein LBR69_03730 [Endomicrobium sp.]|jgi:signal transduction histidine kinase/MFS family permease|nr:hypothetical protein [Endomicrobium sp.]